MKRKSGCFFVLAIIFMIIGFILLIRSCLSKYDEYSIVGNVRLFQKGSSSLIVYIQNYYKVTSYSQEGALTSIGGKHRYFLETRDASTLQLIKSTRLEASDKHFPTIVGNSDKILWIFNGELIGYDPSTHIVICDEDKLAALNPELQNNLPGESRYFTFDYHSNQLEIFTKNAIRYVLKDNYKVTIKEEDDKEPAEITQLKTLLNSYKEQQKNTRHASYFLLWDSIRNIDQRIDALENEYQNQKDFRERLNQINKEHMVSLNDLTINIVLHDSMAYALTPRKGIDTARHYLYINQNFSLEEQKYLSKAKLKQVTNSRGMNSYLVVEKQTPVNLTQSFLKGCFLLDKKTLQAIKLPNPESWFILSAKEVGQNSPLILQRVDVTGKILWTIELPVKSFKDTELAGKNLIIYSNHDQYINGENQSDQLFSIEINTGKIKEADLIPD